MLQYRVAGISFVYCSSCWWFQIPSTEKPKENKSVRSFSMKCIVHY